MLELKKKLASYCIKNNLHPMETIVKNININSFRVVIGDEWYSFEYDELDDAMSTLYDLGYTLGEENQYGDMVDLVVDVETEFGFHGLRINGAQKITVIDKMIIISGEKMLVTDIEFRDEYNKMIEIKKSENKSDDADVFDCQNV